MEVAARFLAKHLADKDEIEIRGVKPLVLNDDYSGFIWPLSIISDAFKKVKPMFGERGMVILYADSCDIVRLNEYTSLETYKMLASTNFEMLILRFEMIPLLKRFALESGDKLKTKYCKIILGETGESINTDFVDAEVVLPTYPLDV